MNLFFSRLTYFSSLFITILSLLSLINPCRCSFHKFSTVFPSVEEATDFATLSANFYYVSACTNADEILQISNLTCYVFGQGPDDVEYMVAFNDNSEYIAVVYAGTFSVEDLLIDLDIDFTTFELSPEKYSNTIQIHRGMNSVLFKTGIWDEIVILVQELLKEKASYRIITSGHSLGGAEAIITAVALGQALPNYNITSLSYGTPKIGNDAWMNYVNSMENVAIWRFVNDNDLVPRYPKGSYRHVGHTVQLNENKAAKAYYLHYGDADLKLKGVPFTWDILIPKFSELEDHSSYNYAVYMNEKSLIVPKLYYADEFEKSTNIFDI